MMNKSLNVLLASAAIAFCSIGSVLAGGVAEPDEEPTVVVVIVDDEPKTAPVTDDHNAFESQSGDGARICGMRGQAFVCTNN